MSSLWVSLLVVAVMGPDGTGGASTPAATNAAESHRQGYELRDAVREALRQWARPADDKAAQAARQFLALYQELQADTQLARSQREQLRAQVRSRLAQLSEQISNRLARDKRLAKAERPKTVNAPAGQVAPLAQQLGGGAMAGGMAGGNPGAGANRQGAWQQWGLPDAGQELVDLIQRVISPKSWDVNGGPGSIYYWQPGHALIIRQTTEVHEQIGDTLEQLRKLDR